MFPQSSIVLLLVACPFLFVELSCNWWLCTVHSGSTTNCCNVNNNGNANNNNAANSNGVAFGSYIVRHSNPEVTRVSSTNLLLFYTCVYSLRRKQYYIRRSG